MKKVILYSLVAGSTMFLAACGGEEAATTTPENGTPETTQTETTPPADPNTMNTDAVGNPNTAGETAVGPTTTVNFEETAFDFGSVEAGEKVKHVFTFTNTGSEDLIISQAKPSCGCTVPNFSKEPIPPGGTGEINVEFDSGGKNGEQNKTVTVTANTDPATTILTIRGTVQGAAAPAQ